MGAPDLMPLIHGFSKAPDSLAQALSQFRKPFGAKDKESDHEDYDELLSAKTKHMAIASLKKLQKDEDSAGRKGDISTTKDWRLLIGGKN